MSGPAITTLLNYSDALISLVEQFEQIKKEQSRFSSSQPDNSPIRIELPIDIGDLLEWISMRAAGCKIYWRQRDEQMETAAVGIADELKLDEPGESHSFTEEALRRLAGTEQARYFGGMAFNPDADIQPEGAWKSFGRARFVLPRFEITRSPEDTLLVCNLLPAELSKLTVKDLLAPLQETTLSNEQHTKLSFRRQDSPDRPGWNKQLRQTNDLFASGRLQKLVLARQSRLAGDETIDPWHLLRRLRQDNQDCYLFLFQTEPGTALVGATPERLYRRINDRIESEAVAGTRVRGDDDKQDMALGRELLESEKDGREHELVVRGIKERLQPSCNELTHDMSPSLLKLSRVQHLVTRFQGELRSNINDAVLLNALHPTPAVAGYPEKAAVAAIESIESFDRGWYCGPLGWLGSRQTEFAVTLRCGLVHNNTLTLFSGAGLVAGSTAEEEWQEIESKIDGFIASVTD